MKKTYYNRHLINWDVFTAKSIFFSKNYHSNDLTLGLVLGSHEGISPLLMDPSSKQGEYTQSTTSQSFHPALPADVSFNEIFQTFRLAETLNAGTKWRHTQVTSWKILYGRAGTWATFEVTAKDLNIYVNVVF